MLIDGRPTVRSRMLWTIFVICGLVVSACAAPAAPAGEGAPAAPAVPAASEVVLKVWIPSWLDGERGILESQLVTFTKETSITWTLEYVSWDDILRTKLPLLVEVEQDVPDLLLGMNYYAIAKLHQSGILESLEELRDDDFLGDALKSNEFPNAESPEPFLRGIPWRRDACSPRYLNLARPIKGQHSQEANQLIEFLTRADIQKDTFDKLQSWPTRKSVELPVEDACPEFVAQVHRLYTLETDVTNQFIAQRIDSLQAQIAGEPTAVLCPDLNEEDRSELPTDLCSEERRRTIEYIEPDSETISENIQAAAVPVVLGGDENLWREKANSFVEDLAQPGSATVGALLIQYDWEGIPPGAYIVDCTTDGMSEPMLDCKTIDSNSNEVNLANYELDAWWEDTQSDVGYPFATYETGSPGRFCFYIDGRKCCIGR